MRIDASREHIEENFLVTPLSQSIPQRMKLNFGRTVLFPGSTAPLLYRVETVGASFDREICSDVRDDKLLLTFATVLG